jgi:hypothetical protein
MSVLTRTGEAPRGERSRANDTTSLAQSNPVEHVRPGRVPFRERGVSEGDCEDRKVRRADPPGVDL